MIKEPETPAVRRHLAPGGALVTSRIALVEVPRATKLANPSAAVAHEVDRLLGSCMLVAVSPPLLRAARALISSEIRTLDAIHLASALRLEADELVAYDRRLLEAAALHGLAVASPGATLAG